MTIKAADIKTEKRVYRLKTWMSCRVYFFDTLVALIGRFLGIGNAVR